MYYILLSFILLPSIVYADLITDGTLGAKIQLSAPDYRISPDLGLQVETTLFHSFETFNLNEHETATFIGGTSQLDAIVSRVTGNHLSNIDGLLRTEGLAEAVDFFFINPNGIVLGEHAQLDINGSIYFSTADTLYLIDEETGATGEFSATHPEQSILTVPHPVAFGFLDNDIAPLTINGSQLKMKNGNLFGVAAGEITITNGATILTPPILDTDPSIPFDSEQEIDLNSGIALVSLAATGTLLLDGINESFTLTDQSEPDADIPLFRLNRDPNHVLVSFDGAQFGDIHITDDSHLIADSEGNSAALVYLQGQHIQFDNYSSITANAYGNQTESTLGNYIWLLGNSLTLDNKSQIYGQKRSGTGFGSGVFAFIRDEIQLLNQSGISIDTLSEGNAGSAVIFTQNLYMENSFMSSNSEGTGQGGGIWVEATESIHLKGSDDQIVQQANAFSERLKDTNISEEQQILFDGLDDIRALNIARFSGDSVQQGNAGAIYLLTKQFDADTFTLTSEAVNGNAGGVFIQADDILLNYFMISSSILNQGMGGKVYLNANNSLMAQRGLFLSIAGDDALAGDISITGDILYFDQANISTSARRAGGGDITMHTHNIGLLSNTEILASVEESIGDGGDIHISFPFYLVSNKSSLLAQASGGNGGNISIQAYNLIASDDSIIDASLNKVLMAKLSSKPPKSTLMKQRLCLNLIFS